MERLKSKIGGLIPHPSSSRHASSKLVSDPEARRKSKRPAGPSGLSSHRQRDSARNASQQGSSSPDSLNLARTSADHKPSRTHEDSTRRLQQWASGGAPTEKRQEAASRILQSKQNNSVITDLRDLSLQSLPTEISTLTETKALWLSNNDLDRLPSSVGKLSNLQVLEANRNQLGFGSKYEGISEDLGRLSNLEILSLQDNNLSTLPPSIGNLSRLRELDVSQNRLENLPSELANLSQLERLSAHHNQLSQLPGSMGVMSQLRSVDVSNNQLWNLPDTWGRVPNQPSSLSEKLRELNVSDNNLQQLPNSFAKPQKRLVLDVTNNPLETLPINYGGFSYADQPLSREKDHTLTNQDRSVKAHVRDTQVRQGLVNEGRLTSGRGVYSSGPLRSAQNRRPPKPMVDTYDADSIYSVEDYIEDHREAGAIQNIGVVGRDAGMPGAIPSVSADWADQRASAWANTQAGAYATRNHPAPPPAPENPIPQWDTAVPAVFRDDLSSRSSAPSYVATRAPQASLQPEFLDHLYTHLAELPPQQQLYMQQCIDRMPPDQVVAELQRLQNQVGATAYGNAPAATSRRAPTLATNLGGLSRSGRSAANTVSASTSAGNADRWASQPPWAKTLPEPENKTMFGKVKSLLGNFG